LLDQLDQQKKMGVVGIAVGLILLLLIIVICCATISSGHFAERIHAIKAINISIL
jgi:hypothetical protein